MNILLAYDGSPCSEAAIDDLSKAGLPATGNAMALSIAEVWLPPADGVSETASESKVERLLVHHRAKGAQLVEAARDKIELASERIRRTLPGWNVTARATYGSPAWEILAAAEDHAADLIIAGSHGQSALSRFFLGSISQKVISEARCSVRVARGRNQTDPSPIRIVIGFDSTRGAAAAVDSVAKRSWPAGTEVRLLTVIQHTSPSLIGNLIPPVVSAVGELNYAEQELVNELAVSAIEKLSISGLSTTFHTESGNPRTAIIEHAEAWNADSIFVGANAFGGALERFLIGSTSAAVAARAHCSVEVVRTR